MAFPSCAHCDTRNACVQCSRCKNKFYCGVECACADWDITHAAECMDASIGIPIFFENGYQLFITSIKNGNINIYDIAAQLEASPNYIRTFLNWTMMNDIASEIAVALGYVSIQVIIQRLFMIAVHENYIRVARALLQDPRVDPAFDDHEAIRDAANHVDYKNMVALLLNDARVNPAGHNNEAIRNAVRKGNMTIIRYILKDPRVDPSAFRNYAFWVTVLHNRLDIAQLLLRDPRVDPSDRNHDALKTAVENGNVDFVKFLLTDPRVAKTAPFNDVIRSASRMGRAAVLEVLLNHPGVHVTDNYVRNYRRDAKSKQVKAIWNRYLKTLQRQERNTNNNNNDDAEPPRKFLKDSL